MEFKDVEREIIKYFLNSKPSYKKEISDRTGVNKNLCREVCDRLSSNKLKILEKSYRISRRGYLLHYSLSPDFSAFLCIAKNFLPKESAVFLKSKYAQEMFARHGYARLFRSLGVKKDYLRDILPEYSFIKKRLFTYVLLYPGTAAEISSSLSGFEKPPWRVSLLLEEMRREKVLFKDGDKYFVSPKFMRKTIKEHPELYPFRLKLPELIQNIEEKLSRIKKYAS